MPVRCRVNYCRTLFKVTKRLYKAVKLAYTIRADFLLYTLPAGEDRSQFLTLQICPLMAIKSALNMYDSKFASKS